MTAGDSRFERRESFHESSGSLLKTVQDHNQATEVKNFPKRPGGSKGTIAAVGRES
jgi:hypothetical protein